MIIALENAKYLEGIDAEQIEKDYANIYDVLTAPVVLKKVELPKGTEILGFSILLPEQQKENKPYIYLERLGEKYRLEVSLSAKGNARRISNALKSFDKRVEDTLNFYETKKKRQEDISAILQIEDMSYEQKLKI